MSSIDEELANGVTVLLTNNQFITKTSNTLHYKLLTKLLENNSQCLLYDCSSMEDLSRAVLRGRVSVDSVELLSNGF